MIQYSPELFVNRKEELESTLKDLERCSAVAVMGMRKIGKTWFLQRMKDSILGENETSVVKIFRCSGCKNFEDLMISIVRDLRVELVHRSFPRVSKILDVINDLRALKNYREKETRKKTRRGSRILHSGDASLGIGPFKGRWRYEQSHLDDYVEKTLHEIGEDFLDILDAFENRGKEIVLMIDEFGIFNWGAEPDLSQMMVTTSFWKPVVENFGEYQRLIVAASINLFAVSNRGLPLREKVLGPFTQTSEEQGDPSLEIIERMSEHLWIKLSEGERKALKEVGKGFPYYSLRGVEIAGMLKKQGKVVSEQIVRKRIIDEIRKNDIPSLKRFYSPREMKTLQKVAQEVIIPYNHLAGSYLGNNYILEFRDGMWTFSDPLLSEAFLRHYQQGGEE